MFKSHYVAPVYTGASHILYLTHIEVQEESSLYSLALQRTLDGLAEVDKGTEKGDKPSGYMAGSSQQMEMDKLAKLMEETKRKLDVSLYDGFGDPHSHLKAYLNKLEGIGQIEDHKTKHFITTLSGSALIWSNGILQPTHCGIPNPLHKDFDQNKHRAFRSGM
ncbi:hypothetical protein HAX54_032690 [Datura stramonium]|uniref:Reverse transcriptase domain-containing protein n=1 Tax=Datura stramonium TaxID=4076 RepID=A0ABS8VDC3_DATST|nr:hypothetical protein [Datura stramonium]